MKLQPILAAMLATGLIAACFSRPAATQAQDGAAEPAAESGEVQVIETKEMMEILIDPQIEILRDSLATEPTDRRQLRSAYLASFTLAELHNLLFSREGEDYMATPEWAAMAKTGREAAAAVGKAVQARDYPAMVKTYEALVASCNACHEKFQQPQDLILVDVWDPGKEPKLE